ncbi:MAG: DUF937 domain-containing protein [Rhodomicrobium sp.]|nr:DUF937 domain-containing protein [Rhodomicrobium sp.]
MGIFDALSGALGEAMRRYGKSGQAGQPEAGVSKDTVQGSSPEVLASAGFGSLSGLVQRLSAGGLSEQVSSWLGSGANLPVNAEQLRGALGNEEVQRIAQQFGLPADRILQILSQYLPSTVDQASPDGKLEEPDQIRH